MHDFDKPVVIVDGSYFLHRFWHGSTPRYTRGYFPTHVIYGLVNSIGKLFTQYDPTHMAVVFDPSGRDTFRHKLSASYKGDRPPMPEDFKRQIQPTIDILRALGIFVIQEPGVEGDDVIGTLTKIVTDAGMRALIVSADKDLAQLISSHVTMYDHFKLTGLDYERAWLKWGVRPERMADYLALVGDTADGIPGVPGIGKQTASNLIGKYGSIDGIYENLPELPAKTSSWLNQNRELVQLYLKLTTIVTDFDLRVRIDDLKVCDTDNQLLCELYKQFEFHDLLSEVNYCY